MAVLLGSASASVSLNIADFMGNADQVIGKMDQMGSYRGSGSGPSFFDKMTKGALGLGTALIAPMGIGLKAAIDLEQGIANINASLGGLDSSTLDALADSFNEVGAASQYSAIEVAVVADNLAKAGFGVDDLLGGMTESIVFLSQATGDGLAPATEGMIQVFAMWSEEIVGVDNAMTDATRAADIFTTASNQSAGGIQDIVAGLRGAGPAMAGVGLSFEDSAAAIALFTNYGFSGAEIGTKLNRTLTQLANPTAEAATLMSDLGIAAFDMEGNFIGFPALFDQLQVGFAGMGDEARLSALKVIFGAEAFDLMAIAAETGGDPLRVMQDLMLDTGVAAEQSALRMDTLGAQFDTLKEGITTFLGSLVSGLLPGLRLFVDVGNTVVDMLMKIPDPIKTVIGAVAGLWAGITSITIALKGWAALTGLLGISGGLGLGAMLGALIPIALAVAAAAGGIYLAWKTNFGGIRALVGNVVGGVTGFINRFTSAFKKVESPAKKLAGAFSKLSKPMDTLRKGFEGVAGLLTDIIDPFEALADRGTALGDSVSRLLRPVDDLQAQYDRMNDSLRPVIDSVTTLGRVFDSLAFAIRGINGGDIPDWLQDIAGFFESAADAADKFMAAFDLARAAAAFSGDNPFMAFIEGLRAGLDTLDLGNIAITIGGWAINAVVDVVSALGGWIAGQVGSFVHNIPGIVVNIGQWIKGTWDDLWSTVTGWFTGADDGMSGDGTGGARPARELSIGDVVVNIGKWVRGKWDDLWQTVLGWVMGGSAEPGSQESYDQLGREITIGAVTVHIGQWLRGEWDDLWETVTGWIMGTDRTVSGAAKGGGGREVTIGDVSVNIGSWAKGIITDIATYIATWAGEAIDGVTSAAATIWNVAINVGSWAKGIISDIWPYVRQWASDAISGATSAAGTLWNVVVNVGSWAKGIVSDIWPFVSMWAADAWEAVKSASHTVWSVIVDVGSWTKGEILEPIGTTINDAVTSAYADYVAEGVAPQLSGVEVELTDLDITVAEGEMSSALKSATGDQSEAEAAYYSGYQYGFVFAQKIVDGINSGLEMFGALFSEGPGSPGAGWVGDFVAAGAGMGITVVGAIDGAFIAISNGMRSIPSTAFNQLLKPELERIFNKDAFETELSTIWEGLSTIGSGAVEGFSNMFGPQSPLALGIKSTFNALKIFIENAWDVLTNIELNPLDWNWGALLPEPEWPDWLTTTPDWWTNIQAGRMPWDNGGGSDSGVDPDWKSIDAPGGMSGPHRGMMPDLQFGMPDWSGIIDQISGVRVEMDGVKVAAQDTGTALDTAFGSGFDTSGITGAVSIAKTEMASLVTSAQLMTVSIAMAGRSLGQAYGTGVAAGITSSAGAVSSAVSGLITTAGGYRATALITGTATGSMFGSGMAAGIRSQQGNVSSAALALVTAAGGYRATALIAGAGIGSALGQGIAAGIRSQLGNVIAAAVGIVNAAIGAAKLAGAISSPSRLMREDVGQMLGLGAVLGVKDMYDDMNRAMAGLISVPVVSGRPNQSYAGAGSSGSTNVTNLSVKVNVEGNIAAEDEFGDRVSTRLVNALTDEIERHRAAVGVN